MTKSLTVSLIDLVIVILIMSFVIAPIHETGHLIVAKLLGVCVKDYSLWPTFQLSSPFFNDAYTVIYTNSSTQFDITLSCFGGLLFSQMSSVLFLLIFRKNHLKFELLLLCIISVNFTSAERDMEYISRLWGYPSVLGLTLSLLCTAIIGICVIRSIMRRNARLT